MSGLLGASPGLQNDLTSRSVFLPGPPRVGACTCGALTQNGLLPTPTLLTHAYGAPTAAGVKQPLSLTLLPLTVCPAFLHVRVCRDTVRLTTSVLFQLLRLQKLEWLCSITPMTRLNPPQPACLPATTTTTTRLHQVVS